MEKHAWNWKILRLFVAVWAALMGAAGAESSSDAPTRTAVGMEPPLYKGDPEAAPLYRGDPEAAFIEEFVGPASEGQLFSSSKKKVVQLSQSFMCTWLKLVVVPAIRE
jgi:hypothetical protein